MYELACAVLVVNVSLFIYAAIDIEKDYRNFKVDKTSLTLLTVQNTFNDIKNALRSSTFSVKIVIIFICIVLSPFLLSIPCYMNYRLQKYIKDNPEKFI